MVVVWWIIGGILYLLVLFSIWAIIYVGSTEDEIIERQFQNGSESDGRAGGTDLH